MWWVFALWATVLGAVHASVWAGQAWFYFVDGSHALFSSEGLHLYARHPELQIGPLTFVVVAPLVFGLPGHASEIAAIVLMSGAGLVVLAEIRRLTPARSASTDRTFLLVGICLLPVWSELAVTYAHPEDVLAVLSTVFALRAVRSGRLFTAAFVLALAADFKPWAVAFVPLLLLADRRDRLRVFSIWLATIAAAWLPFYLADHRTLSAGAYEIPNSLASSLRVFGVDAASTPTWDRPAQFVLATALGVVMMRRGRWSAVVLVAVAARLLLDPSVKSYYDAALLAGTAICDLVLLGGPIPALTLSAALVFYLPMFALQSEPHIYGLVRTAYLLSVLALVTFVPDSKVRAVADKPHAGLTTTGPARFHLCQATSRSRP